MKVVELIMHENRKDSECNYIAYGILKLYHNCQFTTYLRKNWVDSMDSIQTL